MSGNPSAVGFSKLFTGLKRSYGTGKGSWVHEEVKLRHYSAHLAGQGPGLGIAPLRDNGTVSFAAIDLDEPDFASARIMAEMLPGRTFIERSRSGNAHVWAFFAEPIEGWIPRGIMREATAAIGKPTVEVFPKQDKLRAGMFGNYINLPYYGNTRPILMDDLDQSRGLHSGPHDHTDEWGFSEMLLETFVEQATADLNDPADWRKRARWLGIPSPEERSSESNFDHGTAPFLHVCCEHVIANRESNPVQEGHRAVVFFCMAKQLAHTSMFNSEESLQLMALVNDASPDPIPESELRRILFNAERGQFTSTGCDDPLFSPYAHPDCPIANPRKAR